MTVGPDVLGGREQNLLGPGTPFPITLSDSADLTYVTRMVTIGTSGDVKCNVVNPDGTITAGVVLPAVPVGSYPWRLSRIWSAGTTASGFTGTR